MFGDQIPESIKAMQRSINRLAVIMIFNDIDGGLLDFLCGCIVSKKTDKQCCSNGFLMECVFEYF